LPSESSLNQKVALTLSLRSLSKQTCIYFQSNCCWPVFKNRKYQLYELHAALLDEK